LGAWVLRKVTRGSSMVDRDISGKVGAKNLVKIG
jgi:hypothetical protein